MITVNNSLTITNVCVAYYRSWSRWIITLCRCLYRNDYLRFLIEYLLFQTTLPQFPLHKLGSSTPRNWSWFASKLSFCKWSHILFEISSNLIVIKYIEGLPLKGSSILFLEISLYYEISTAVHKNSVIRIWVIISLSASFFVQCEASDRFRGCARNV